MRQKNVTIAVINGTGKQLTTIKQLLEECYKDDCVTIEEVKNSEVEACCIKMLPKLQEDCIIQIPELQKFTAEMEKDWVLEIPEILECSKTTESFEKMTQTIKRNNKRYQVMKKQYQKPHISNKHYQRRNIK